MNWFKKDKETEKLDARNKEILHQLNELTLKICNAPAPLDVVSKEEYLERLKSQGRGR